jgi:hypothetical protein
LFFKPSLMTDRRQSMAGRQRYYYAMLQRNLLYTGRAEEGGGYSSTLVISNGVEEADRSLGRGLAATPPR